MPSRLKITGTKEQLYEFQVANQEVDDVVKVMLRSYSGLFFEYVNIFESEITTRTKLDKAKVLNILYRLEEHELVSYFPQSSLPKLSFGRGRIDTGLLTFSKENYELRKKVFQQKIDAVLNYADNKIFCRSRLLLAYFGETNSENCGGCDICLERNKQELNTADFEKISEKIKSLLMNSQLSLKELLEKYGSNKETLIIKTLQQLLDEEIVTYNDENKLQLVNE